MAAVEVEEGKFDVVVKVETGIQRREIPLIDLYPQKQCLFFRLKVKKCLTTLSPSSQEIFFFF